MKILGIETSCDETAVCLIETGGTFEKGDIRIEVLGNALHSQIESHKEFGGVVPMMAKREHAANLIPLFLRVADEAKINFSTTPPFRHPPQLIEHNHLLGEEGRKKLTDIFGRETEFKNDFIKFIQNHPFPPSSTEEGVGGGLIDAIAVTEGPGLEPALWMGIIFAQALSVVYEIPIIPINHMEGHVLSALFKEVKSHKVYKVEQKIEFPIISLLISGGHTELILTKDWGSYEIIGETRDDAVGEAFDKVARMLGLPYPGGPEISRLANTLRSETPQCIEGFHSSKKYTLPRPMINSENYDFSFSGLKTAVLYSLKKQEIRKEIVAKEFEDAITEVIVSKTLRAVEEHNAHTLIIGGGVVSNAHIRSEFQKKLENLPEVKLLIPAADLRTDNALMIAMASCLKYPSRKMGREIKASGTLRLAK